MRQRAFSISVIARAGGQSPSGRLSNGANHQRMTKSRKLRLGVAQSPRHHRRDNDLDFGQS
jgi:hypothetical protein